MFQVGDIVKTHKIRGTARFVGVVVRIIDEHQQSGYPYVVQWLNATAKESPIAYFKSEHLRKVS
jgi:uncharacterized protein YijF (DUF1287 family)